MGLQPKLTFFDFCGNVILNYADSNLRPALIQIKITAQFICFAVKQKVSNQTAQQLVIEAHALASGLAPLSGYCPLELPTILNGDIALIYNYLVEFSYSMMIYHKMRLRLLIEHNQNLQRSYR